MVSVTRKLGKSHLSRIGDRGQVSGFWRHAACGRSQLFSARRAPAPAHSSARHRSAPKHQRQSGGQSGLGARIRIAQLAEGGASPTLWVRSGWIADNRRSHGQRSGCAERSHPHGYPKPRWIGGSHTWSTPSVKYFTLHDRFPWNAEHGRISRPSGMCRFFALALRTLA